MTTPMAPGAPEAGQDPSGEPTAPGAPEVEPQQHDPAQNASTQRLGRPIQQGHLQAPGAPQQPAEPAGQDDDPQTVESLPAWAQKLIKDARADAGKARTSAKQQAADEARQGLLAEISKTLGLDPDAEPTVEDLTSQLAERQQRIEELEAAQTEHAYREVVRSAAAAANADAEALLDSSSFLKAVQDQLDDDEFTDDDLAAAVKKVAAEYAKQARFQKTTAPARSGGEITGGPPSATKQRARSLTQAVGRAYGGG